MRPLYIGVLIGSVLAVSSHAQTLPAQPQTFLDTTYPAMSGGTINVPAGGDLQAAIDSAHYGDTITLAPGATYVGPFGLPLKAGTGWIVIRTAAADNTLPAPGTRLTAAGAANFPKIVSPNTGFALLTDPGAHHYRVTGVEFTVGASVTTNYGLISLGDDVTAVLANLAHDFVLDRVYIHGNNTANVRRGVAFNAASCAVVDSYIADIHEVGGDAQAIAGWNGSGPFKITNNYLEASGENILFGGSDPSVPNLVPSDIEVRNNYSAKKLQWRVGDPLYAGTHWTVKNLFELKNARRVLVDGNVFEYNWPDAQNGFSILFTVRNQDGTAPWSTVEDVTFTHNIVRHIAAAVNILGTDDNFPSQQTKRILIANNLFDDVNATNWGGNGRLFQILDGAADITIDHNTAFHTGEVIAAAGPATTGLTYRNNLSPNNQYGIAGDNFYGNPLGTLSTYFPGAVVTNNIFQGGNAAKYPPNNFFPTTMTQVMFVDLAGGNYRLQLASPYHNAGTDGKDIGADINTLTGPQGNPVAVPLQFVATATSQSQASLSWLAVSGAIGYEVWREPAPNTFALAVSASASPATDSGLAANTSYVYKVRALGLTGASAFSNVDATTTTIFTDASLTGHAIRAVHLAELRTAVNAMRLAAGLAPATVTDADPNGAPVRRIHIVELRSALDAARALIGVPPLSYGESITAGSTRVKASHFQELRDGVH